MKNLGLKKALILSVVLLVSCSVSISSFLLYLQERESLTEAISSQSKTYVELKASVIETLINEKVAGINKLADQFNNKEIKGSDDELIERVHFLANAMNLSSATLAFENGKAYWNQEHAEWPGGVYIKDVTLRPWYQSGRSASDLTVTDPYGEDVYYITIVEKVKSGTISADMELSFLNELVQQSNDIPGATVAILNHDSTFLASNSSVVKSGQKGIELSWFKNIFPEIASNESIEFSYQLNGVDKTLFSHRIHIGDKEWYFILSLDKSTVLSVLDGSRDSAILVAALATLISAVVAFAIIHILYKPVLSLKQTVIDLSSGDADLTQRLEVKSNDDLGQIAQGVNQFVENLQQMMLQVQDVTMNLQSNVNRINENSQRNKATLGAHITETEQIVAAIEEMNATAGSMASDAASTANLTQRANDSSEQSKKSVEHSAHIVSSLISDVDNASENVQKMNMEAQGINEVLSVIGDIAEQTNLLALNAAIEAARAGEQGRGFAVVADEVRNLARRTKDSTSEVEVALNQLLKGTKAVVDSMDNTKVRCKETADGAGDVATNLGEMSNFVDEINDLSVQIATAAEQQSSVTQDLSQNMISISEIVSKLDQSGQENLVELEQVAEINHQLLSVVNRFNL